VKLLAREGLRGCGSECTNVAQNVKRDLCQIRRKDLRTSEEFPEGVFRKSMFLSLESAILSGFDISVTSPGPNQGSSKRKSTFSFESIEIILGSAARNALKP
jgi:hypothetical protein